MRIAIFSDVHGNLSALKAVLNDIGQQKPFDRVVFAGDACLAGARPLECIAELRRRKITCIVGNTDHWILHPPPLIEDADDDAREKRLILRELCRWTHEAVGKEGESWLEELQSSFSVSISATPNHDQDLLIVHANPKDLLRIVFPSEGRQLELYGAIRQPDEELRPLFSQVKALMIAFGHLHIPSLRTWRNFSLANISSVSLPGDGDPRAKYAIINCRSDNSWEVEWRKINYAIEGEIEAYLENQPPGWRESVEILRTDGAIAQKV